MATNAKTSKGTFLSINTTGSTFVKIAEMKDFSGLGGGQSAVLDATHLESTAREKLPGIADEGSVNAVFNYVSNDPGQMALRAARLSATATKFKLTSNGEVSAFTGLVLKAETGYSVDKVSELMTTIEISDNVVTTPAV